MARILFISHEATRTGAVRLLLDMQHWLKKNSAHGFVTVLLRGGAAEAEFDSMGQVIRAYRDENNISLSQKIRKRFSSTSAWNPLNQAVSAVERLPKFDLVYSNTMASGRGLAALRTSAPIAVTHAHEMAVLVKSYGAENLASILLHTSHFIGVSRAVLDGLNKHFNIATERLSLVPGFSPFQPANEMTPTSGDRSLIRKLGIPDSALIVGACGAAFQHKGYDLIPQLALHLPISIGGRPVHVVHLGAFRHESDLDLVQRDVELAGLQGRVHFVGEVSNPLDWMRLFNVHILLSRVDSFPLVVLEAASMSIPTVCFKSAGGAPEFCTDGAGISVPYLDLHEAATAVERILSDAGLAASLGAAAHQRFMSRHQCDLVMPEWLKLIEHLIQVPAQH